MNRPSLRRLVLLLALLVPAALPPAAPVAARPAAQPVIFGDGLLPGPGSTVPAGAVTIGCTVNSALGLATYSLTVDDAPLATTLSAAGPPWQLRATANLSAGPHTAAALVTDTAGGSGGWTWQFTVTGAAGGQPAPQPGIGGPTSVLASPDAGWLVPAGNLRVAVLFGSDTGWARQSISVDSKGLDTKVEGAAAGHQMVAGTASLSAGSHTVNATGADTTGRATTGEWAFLASDPIGDGDLRVTPLAPAPGSTMPSGAPVRLVARLQSKANLQTSSILLDGRALLNEAPKGDPHESQTLVDTSPLADGRHTVQVQASDSSGKSSTVTWDFYLGPPAAPADRVYYAATGFSISGPFRRYWDTLGKDALQVLGYPISGLLVERLDDGKPYTVQYFERVRLEWHPENRDTPFEVLYGLLGTQFHRPDPAVPAPAVRAGERYFPETGHLVRGPFLQKWQSTGGLRVHGFPISEEVQEVSATDGRAYLVQYFQRARFEYHPENAGTVFDVLLGMLGHQLYSTRYPGH